MPCAQGVEGAQDAERMTDAKREVGGVATPVAILSPSRIRAALRPREGVWISVVREWVFMPLEFPVFP